MERKNRYDGLHPAAVSSIRYHAKRLARCNTVPSMDIGDYDQHLALNLLRRSDRYDDRRSSFPTFADRVVQSQSASLASPTEARSCEREMLSLDDILPSSTDDGDGTLHDLISGNELVSSTQDGSAHDVADLRVDLARFFESLPPALRRCLGWLVAGGVEAAIRDGLHRSSFYEARWRLRARALTYGLAEYL
jgi:hypothetical protein